MDRIFRRLQHVGATRQRSTRKSRTQNRRGRKECGLARAEAPKSKKRLTFKDQHALDTLPGRIEELQAEIEMLRKTLADPDSLRTRRN